jgi:hypothetical protein
MSKARFHLVQFLIAPAIAWLWLVCQVVPGVDMEMGFTLDAEEEE